MIRQFLIAIALFTSSVSAFPGAGAAGTDPALKNFIQLSRPQSLESVGFLGPHGQPVQLSDFQGQVTMINLWATWCPPCVRELPSLERFRAEYADKGIVVVPIATDQDPGVVAPFLKQLGMADMSTYYDNRNSFGQILPTDLIPATYILDENGQLVAFVRSFVDWDNPAVRQMLDGYLKPKS
ncbi:TlpA family protein disulfide reductase [Ferrimonas lipolytica]|uniref:TlpA family protein disulfide reductase n=1 Tax=Ferrimonas lipolytica TaxID=2724191 RepID=A0A6H1UHH0_9GAMM|nr:TlpA disulfide reductase family protein [Ferrimonas lipolytica]QIZ78494.1 TlpA family protein disulfide reductase [Ferrimonas lipolytica]